MQGFLLLLALLTAQNNGADLSQTQVSNARGQVVVSWQGDECLAEDDGCFVYADRVGTNIETVTYNGAISGTRFGMGRSVRHMARLLGNYTGQYKHRVGRTNGHVVIEEWRASYTGGNCPNKCRVLIFRTRDFVGDKWSWGSEVG